MKNLTYYVIENLNNSNCDVVTEELHEQNIEEVKEQIWNLYNLETDDLETYYSSKRGKSFSK